MKSSDFNPRPEKSCCLIGPTGAGKTYTLRYWYREIGKTQEFQSRKWNVLYTREVDLDASFKKSVRFDRGGIGEPGKSVEEIKSEYRRLKITHLFIDEILHPAVWMNTRTAGLTAQESLKMLWQFYDWLYESMDKTVVYATTNRKPDAVLTGEYAPLARRIREIFTVKGIGFVDMSERKGA